MTLDEAISTVLEQVDGVCIPGCEMLALDKATLSIIVAMAYRAGECNQLESFPSYVNDAIEAVR